MKYICHMFSILSATILFILIATTNTPFQLFSQNTIYATTTEQQEDLSSSSNENDDSLNENETPKSSQEATESKETEESNGEEENSNDNGNALSSTANQSNECPDTNDLTNVPTYITQDGCEYPCPSPDNDIREGCSLESPSQATTGFSINEERPIQPQQNFDSKSAQNTFTGSKIGSDTTITNIPNTESTPTTTKSYNPGGLIKLGSEQTESSIPSLSYNPAKPYPGNLSPPYRQGAVILLSTNPETSFTSEDGQSKSDIPNQSTNFDDPLSPGAGNAERQGSSLDPKTQTELSNPIQTGGPAGQFKLGSEQTELTIPSDSSSVARPLTPGAANTQVEGIPTQPNTNPQTPIDPGNIPTTIPDKAYLTVVTKMMNFYTGFLKVSDFEICVQSTIQADGNSKTVDAIPRCANGSASGVQYTVQAPGSITIWVNNLDELGVQSLMIETPNLSNNINAHESKTSTIYISPYQSQGP